MYTGIGLGLRDARFFTLYYKIAHNSYGECAIFASRVVYRVNIEIAHTIGKNHALKSTEMRDFAHYNIF